MMIINILNTQWTVRILPQLDCALFESDGASFGGKTNYNTKEIIIAEGLMPIKSFEVITHELTHAIIGQLMLHKDTFTEEEVCEFMERYCDYINKLAIDVYDRLGERYNGSFKTN